MPKKVANNNESSFEYFGLLHTESVVELWLITQATTTEDLLSVERGVKKRKRRGMVSFI